MEDVHNGGGEPGGFPWRTVGVTLLVFTAFVLVVVAFVGMSGASASAAGGCGGG